MNRVAKFYKVSWKQFYKDTKDILCTFTNEEIKELYNQIIIPSRKTKSSAGHDMCVPFNVKVMPGDTFKIPTGIRCWMQEDNVMLIFPRSSLGIKKNMSITNTIPVIDADYYEAENEGHIIVCIKNNGIEPLYLNQGDAIVQCVFINYGVADEEEIINKRTGGIGSTDCIRK